MVLTGHGRRYPPLVASLTNDRPTRGAPSRADGGPAGACGANVGARRRRPRAPGCREAPGAPGRRHRRRTGVRRLAGIGPGLCVVEPGHPRHFRGSRAPGRDRGPSHGVRRGSSVPKRGTRRRQPVVAPPGPGPVRGRVPDPRRLPPGSAPHDRVRGRLRTLLARRRPRPAGRDRSLRHLPRLFDRLRGRRGGGPARARRVGHGQPEPDLRAAVCGPLLRHGRRDGGPQPGPRPSAESRWLGFGRLRAAHRGRWPRVVAKRSGPDPLERRARRRGHGHHRHRLWRRNLDASSRPQ